MFDSLMEEKLIAYLQIVKASLIKMGASKEDAEDIVQETAYKFILYMDSVESSRVKSWLFRVAINDYYDLYRKRKRRHNIRLKFNIGEIVEEETPEVAALRREEKEDVERILRNLSSRHREFLLLKYSTGLQIKDIAEVSGMTVASVKTTLYRARQQFMKTYRRQMNE